MWATTSRANHRKHGQYILKNIRLYGYTAPEVALMANPVRYHRSRPKSHHPDFANLSELDKQRVSVMSGMLQVADALDRSHNQPIDDVHVNTKNDGLSCREWESADLGWSASQRKGARKRARPPSRFTSPLSRSREPLLAGRHVAGGRRAEAHDTCGVDTEVHSLP